MKNLEERHLIYDDLDNTPPEYQYKDGGSKLPDWSLFDEIRFSEFQGYQGNEDGEATAKTYNDRGGLFFRYLIKPESPKMIIEYLNKLQIFDTLIENKKVIVGEKLKK